jgi:predicted transglutaminase-like cysteine proteinase
MRVVILSLFLTASLFSFDIDFHQNQNASKYRINHYINFLKSIKNRSEKFKIIKTNTYINSLRGVKDIVTSGSDDIWASREEFLKTGTGDCEDYVIAKYFSLKDLGVNTSKLYFVVVKVKKAPNFHMVLAYFPKADIKKDPYILDNLSWKILKLSRREDLKAKLFFNEKVMFGNKRVVTKLAKNFYLRIDEWKKIIKKEKKFSKYILKNIKGKNGI